MFELSEKNVFKKCEIFYACFITYLLNRFGFEGLGKWFDENWLNLVVKNSQKTQKFLKNVKAIKKA